MPFSSRLVAALSLSLSFGQHAHAEELPIDLNWSAPEGCGSEQSVLADVRSMLGEANSSKTHAVILAEATLRKTNQGKWEVLLKTTLGDNRGERNLVVADCSEAIHATALFLAFMIDPNAPLSPNVEEPRKRDEKSAVQEADTSTRSSVREGHADSPGPLAPSHPVAVAAERRTLTRSERKSPQSQARVFVGLSGMLESGNLPRETIGGALQLGFRVERWSIELRPAAWLPSQVASPQLSSAGGRFRLYDVALLGCYRAFRLSAFTARTCGGTDLFYLHAVGYGMTEPSSRSALYPSALGEIALVYDLTQAWAVRAAGDLLFALARPEYAIFNLGTVHRPARWAGRLALGFELSF